MEPRLVRFAVWMENVGVLLQVTCVWSCCSGCGGCTLAGMVSVSVTLRVHFQPAACTYPKELSVSAVCYLTLTDLNYST